nr:transposase [Methylocystis rosea]
MNAAPGRDHLVKGGRHYPGIPGRHYPVTDGRLRRNRHSRAKDRGCWGFEILPRRWVVERTFAWLGRCRRLAKDFEDTIASAVAWVLVAHVRTLTRRIART